jgi:hypothetical protein
METFPETDKPVALWCFDAIRVLTPALKYSESSRGFELE